MTDDVLAADDRVEASYITPGDCLDSNVTGLEDVLELLTVALREDVTVGAGGRGLMKWTGVDRVLLARDKLAVRMAQLEDDLDAMASGNFT